MNLTPWGQTFCEQFRLFFKNQHNLTVIEDVEFSERSVTSKSKTTKTDSNGLPVLTQGKSFGSIWLLYQMANKLGITDALGDSEEGIKLLHELCIVKAKSNGQDYSLIPKPRPELAELLCHAKVSLPEVVPSGTPPITDSKTKLKTRRKLIK